MKQLKLEEQEELFTDSYIISITDNDLLEWMDIESDYNVTNEMVVDLMVEEEVWNVFKVVRLLWTGVEWLRKRCRCLHDIALCNYWDVI